MIILSATRAFKAYHFEVPPPLIFYTHTLDYPAHVQLEKEALTQDFFNFFSKK